MTAVEARLAQLSLRCSCGWRAVWLLVLFGGLKMQEAYKSLETSCCKGATPSDPRASPSLFATHLFRRRLTPTCTATHLVCFFGRARTVGQRGRFGWDRGGESPWNGTTHVGTPCLDLGFGGKGGLICGPRLDTFPGQSCVGLM